MSKLSIHRCKALNAHAAVVAVLSFAAAAALTPTAQAAEAARPVAAERWRMVDGMVEVRDLKFRETWMNDAGFLQAISASTDPNVQAAKTLWVNFEADLARAGMSGAFNREVDGILAKYVAADYKQHDPNIPDGRAGLAAWMKAGGKHKPPPGQKPSPPPVPVAVIAENGLVSVMLEALVAGNGAQGAGEHYELSQSIFRVKDGMLVEHWDGDTHSTWWCRIGCKKAAAKRP